MSYESSKKATRFVLYFALITGKNSFSSVRNDYEKELRDLKTTTVTTTTGI